MNKKTIAIINYNTPELTEAAIMSIRKHGGEDYRVVIFDNSNARPFTKKMRGVEVIDNTEGQVINFDKELEKFLITRNICSLMGELKRQIFYIHRVDTTIYIF